MRLALDREGGVYVTWLQADEIGNLSFPGRAPKIVEVASQDKGRTFSSPVVVSDQRRQRVGAAVPSVASDGSVIIVYEDYDGDVRDFDNLEGPPWPEPFSLVVSRSLNKGRAFSTAGVIASNVQAVGRFIPFLAAYPSVASTDNGRVYVAWITAHNRQSESLLASSDDGGSSWSSPTVIGNGWGLNVDRAFMPTLAIGNGRLEVAFLGHVQSEAPELLRAFVGISTDMGTTFATRDLSRVAINSHVGPEFSGAQGVPPFMGSRMGLVAWGDTAVVAWPASDPEGAENEQGIVECTVRLL